MRNKTSLFKRSLAALLCFVMVLGMVPVFSMAPMAYADEVTEGDGSTEGGESTDTTTGQQTNITGDYITLPITIRDFAADGMLFEFNENNRNNLSTGATEYTKTERLYTYDEDGDGELEPYTAVYNPTYWDLNAVNGWHTDIDEDGDVDEDDYDYTGIRIYPADATLFESTDYTQVAGVGWYCFIVDTYGNILKVLDRTADKSNIATIMTEVDGAYSVWAWRGAPNVPYYSVLAKVTETNKAQYRFCFTPGSSGATIDVYLGRSYYKNAPTWKYGNLGIYVYDTTYDDTAAAGYLNGFHSTDPAESLAALDAYDAWTVVVYDAYYGKYDVVDVIPNGTEKKDALANYINDPYAGYEFVFVWSDGTNRDFHDHIAAIENNGEYYIKIVETTVGATLFVERTINVNEANTKGFGLLYTLDSDYLPWLSEDNEAENLPNTTYYEYEWNYDTYPTKVELWDADGTVYASEDIYGVGIRTNLVSKKLDPITGKPLYTKSTVSFLAKYMEQIMAVPEIGDNGAYNLHHVMGVKLYDESKQYVGPNSPLAVYDLADIFRLNVTGGLGDYDVAKAKFDARELLYPHQATTWYEAAYYLLHMLWNDSPVDERTGTEGQDGYGMPITNYNRIHLVKTTNADGDECYVFNAKYDGTTYDYKNGEIFNSHFAETENTETRGYTVAYTRAGAEDGAYDNPMPVNRFDPLGPSGAGVNQGYTMSGNTYGDFAQYDDKVRAEYYYETNYNLTLEGHAQFVYHEDSNQYFTFTGDDDVYLYINGIRVLDMGGAHGISKISINLNDVAAQIGLTDGGTYTFDFFYTERHGTAANFGIETNIQIADASMNTTKTGYQNSTNTGYGGPVNADNHVGYSFELQNDGSAHIYNLVFQDDDIGVYFGHDRLQYYPTTYPEDVPEEKQGANLYTIDDLYLIYWNSAGRMTEFVTPGSLTEESLMQHLKDGLNPGEKIGVYGFKYYIPESQWVKSDDETSFTNHVYSFANTDPNGKGTPLHGVADWKVVQMQHPYEAFHVYDWVHKAVSNDPADAENLTWKVPTANDIPVSNSVTVTKADLISKYLETGPAALTLTDEQKAAITIVPCTAAGNKEEHNQNPNVKKDDASGGITYTSDTVGKDTVFFVFEGVKDADGNKLAVYDNLVFSYEVYTYGAVDNVYVLDYGLSVELAGDTFGFQNNDHLELNENTREMTTTVTGMLGQVEDKDDDGNTIKDENGNPVLVWDNVDSNDGTYGIFTFTTEDADGNPASLKYTPDEIINNTDEVYAKFRIVETDENGEEKEFSIFTGVEMVQKITTAPASVVYYEEDFPGITYVDSDENQWVHYETVDEDGNSLAGTEQSANQDSNYGSDPNYGAEADDETNLEDYTGGDKVGDWGDGTLVNPPAEGDITEEWDAPVINTTTLVLDGDADLNTISNAVAGSLNDYLGLGGQASNGTFNALEIKETAKVMHFDFTGTGFELISRTTKDKYAVIMVYVHKIETAENADGEIVETETLVRWQPVICESKGGDLYQVPVISITGLPHENYRVSVMAAYDETVETRILYVDGVRIYGPLGDEALEYYNPEEYRATLYEVKSLIVDRNSSTNMPTAAYVDIEENNGTIMFSIDPDTNESLNSTFIEYTGPFEDEEGEEINMVVTQLVADPETYMNLGPNNEIYFEGGTATSVIAFFATPIEGYPENARTIEIGAHRKVDVVYEATECATLVYGSTPLAIWSSEAYDAEGELVELDNTYDIYSGTEQYYTIDVDNLELVNGKYLVLIGTNDSDFGEILSLTNLKVAGYTLSLPLDFPNENGASVPDDASVYQNARLVRTMIGLTDLAAQAAAEEEVKVLVNENMTVKSATMKATTLTVGKNATVTVKATTEAQRVEIIAPDGSIVDIAKFTRKVSGSTVTFQVQWKVAGARGNGQEYTIRVYDENEYVSANTKTVTLNIR